MATKGVITQRNKEEEGKPKNAQAAERKNRRVLGDIGNVVDGKRENQIARPMTRSLYAQLVAKGQPAIQKNVKKPLQKIENGVVGRKGASVLEAAAVQKKESENGVVGSKGASALEAAAVHKKESDYQKLRTVVIKSPKDEIKQRNTGRKSRPQSSKVAAKSLTSVLSARSKAACGLVNKPEDDPISNIDASDVDNELAAVEYVDDIYTFYKLTEKDGQVHDYMTTQTDINSKMRAILIDWLVEVHRKFDLMPESLYLTINIVDRYLSVKVVPRRELQLVGVGSMLIACKYEEIWAPEVNDFIAISDNAYNREQVLLMEKSILANLEWYLTVPTPYVFLVRYIKSSVPCDPLMENMVFFLAELGLMHYSTIITYCPSIIAASAVYAARCTLKRNPPWTTTLKHYTGYSENQLRDCAKLLVNYHAAVIESKLKAIYKKFSVPEKSAVSLTPAGSVLTPARKVLQ